MWASAVDRAACTALFLVLAFASGLASPAGEPPDEAFHLMYAAHLAREERLPLMDPPAIVEVPVEGNQPPLYYAIGAVALRLAGMGELAFGPPPRNPRSNKQGGTEAAVYQHDAPGYPWAAVERATRLLRVLFLPLGAVVVLACHAAAAKVWPHDRVRPLLAAGLPATVPQFNFIMSSVTNDVAANALAAVVLASLFITAVDGSALPRNALILGALVGLGLMTKMTLIFLLPVGVATFWLAGRSRRGGFRQAAIFAATALAIASPVLLLYCAEYGDPFGLELNRRMFPQRVHDPGLPYFVSTFAPATFFSFWGVFGHMNVHLGKLYWVFVALVAFTAAGLVQRRWGGWTPAEKRVAFPLAIALAGVLAGMIRYNLMFAQPQGRYAFPGLVALALLFAAGVGRLIGPRRWAAIALLAAMAAFNGWILWRVLFPAYADSGP